MLSLGRPEDELVLSFFPADIDATTAAAKDLNPPSALQKVPMRRRSSLFATTLENQAQHRGDVVPPRAAEALPGIKPWDFYIVLREDPMLIAELCTQAALLDFIISGGHHEDDNHAVTEKSSGVFSSGIDDDRDDFFALLDFEDVCDIRGSIARSEQMDLKNNASLRTVNDVPSDNLISAFTCVAKLKLSRVASAYREANAQDESMAKSIFRALDSASSGYINACDIQKYLQKHANVYAVTANDLCCHLLHKHIDGKEDINQNSLEAVLPAAAVTDSLTCEHDHLLGQNALQEILSQPAHHKLASLLHRLVHVQLEYANQQVAVDKMRERALGLQRTSTTAPSSESRSRTRSRMRERIAARQAEKLATGATRSRDQSSLHKSSQGAQSTCVESSNQKVPMFAAEAKQKLPRGFGQVALQRWFKELDVNGDGLVSSCDLRNWCTAANCRDLVDEADLDSLFQPSLPNFTGSPALSKRTTADNLATSTEENATSLFPRTSSSSTAPLVDECANTDHRRPSVVPQAFPAAMHTNSFLDSGTLNEIGLALALARRPLLAARLALIRRLSRAVQAMLVAEACSTAALTAAARAATAADRAATATLSSDQEHNQVFADTAKFAAERAAADAKFAIDEVHARCGQGRSGMIKDSTSNNKDEAIVQNLEARIQEEEVIDPHGTSAYAARHALQEHFLAGARRSLTLLTIEVALEVKLLTWREAEHYSTQLAELRALPPLRPSFSSQQLNSRFEATAVDDNFPRNVQDAEEGEAVSESSEQSKSESLPKTAAVSKTIAKKRAVPARKTSFKEKLSGMMAGSSGHFKNMAQSFDDENGLQECADGKEGSARHAENMNVHRFESSRWASNHHGEAAENSRDQREVQTPVTTSRIVARSRARVRARTLSPPQSISRETATKDLPEEAAVAVGSISSEHLRSEPAQTKSSDSKTRVKKRAVPARQTSFREKLGSMMVGSSGHLKNLAHSLDDDKDEKVNEMERKVGNTEKGIHECSDSSGWTSHQDGACGTSLDRRHGQTSTANSESRTAAHNRAKARARTMSPRRPPPRKEASVSREKQTNTITACLQERAEGAAPLPGKRSPSYPSPATEAESKTKAKKRMVPARKTSFREELVGSMVAGSTSGHFKNMAQSLDDEQHEEQAFEQNHVKSGKVPAFHPNAEKQDNQSSVVWTNHHGGACGTSLDRHQGQTSTANSESRTAARNRAKARARTMSPRRPPPQKLQEPVEATIKATSTSEESLDLPLDRLAHIASNNALPQNSAALLSISSSSLSSSSSSSSEESEDDETYDSDSENVEAYIVPEKEEANDDLPLLMHLRALPPRSLLLDMFDEMNTTASTPVQDLDNRLLDQKTRHRSRKAFGIDGAHVDMDDQEGSSMKL